MPTPVPGFALIASTVNGLDAPPPSVGLALPGNYIPGQELAIFWTATSVPQIEVTGSGGYSSGVLPARATAGYLYAPAPSPGATTTYSISALDAEGSPMVVGFKALTASESINIA